MELFKSKRRADHEIGYKLMDKIGKDSSLVIGQAVVHAYRIKNAMGGLVLDSTLFVVYNTGKARPINE